MNERIKELWEQAVHGDGPHASVIADFAELIVRECAKLANEETSLPYNSYSEKIKKHFGVN